jgi:glycosyltransferase involved in cell wall biosynthesis
LALAVGGQGDQMMTMEETQPDRRVLCIIPALNEADRIAQVIADVRRDAPGVDVLVVDDGSTDRTADVAREAGARVCSLPLNLGYGAALQSGYQYALRRGFDTAVQMDADGQHEPQDVQRLLSGLAEHEADVIIGSRFLGEGRYKVSPVRALAIGLMRFLVRLLTGQRITDPTSGFQALSLRAIRLYASDEYPVDYPDADVLIMAHRAGLRVAEVPVSMYERAAGRSMHDGLKPVWYMFKVLLSVAVTMLRPAAAIERD